jgi:ubiquinone/menaquinone biosynthesis C-methylase UbiE
MSELHIAVPATERYVDSTPSLLQSNIKKQVQKFWQGSPCDSWFTDEPSGTLAFYRSLDEHRYKVHRRLQSAVGFEKTRGLRVLEIGCGCGSEAERFARAGAHYTAIDLTNAAVNITQRRFQLANLEGRFVQGDAENLPFADGSFDLVYSHGVLHHTPDTPRTIREVHRVLAAGGRAVIMLYYRDSFNYHVNLGLVRRLRAHLLRTELGIKLARTIWREPEEELRRHAELIRENPGSYLEMQNMLNRNTDGPDNPLSQAFSKGRRTRCSGNSGMSKQKLRSGIRTGSPAWASCFPSRSRIGSARDGAGISGFTLRNAIWSSQGRQRLHARPIQASTTLKFFPKRSLVEMDARTGLCHCLIRVQRSRTVLSISRVEPT